MSEIISIQDQQYTFTFKDVCQELDKSRKTISKYIKADLLHPKKAKSKRNTLSYMFNKVDLQAFRDKEKRGEVDEKMGMVGKVGTKVGNKVGNDTKTTINKRGEGEKGKGGYGGNLGGKDDRERDNFGQLLDAKDETIELLKKQVADLAETKNNLLERGREHNILISQLQNQLALADPQKKQEQEGIVEEMEIETEPIQSPAKKEEEKKTSGRFIFNLFRAKKHF